MDSLNKLNSLAAISQIGEENTFGSKRCQLYLPRMRIIGTFQKCKESY